MQQIDNQDWRQVKSLVQVTRALRARSRARAYAHPTTAAGADVDLSSTYRSLLRWLATLWHRSRPELLVIMSTLLAYHGALWLGLGMDDYYNIEIYRDNSLATIATWTAYNRSPPYLLLIYPLLLQLPTWLTHLLVIAAHTLSALLLLHLLRWFELDETTITLAGLAFLLWPSHSEVLFWPAASGGAFGVCCVLVGALRMTRGQTLAAVLLAFLGMLFLESIVFPALFSLLVILLRRRVRWANIIATLGSLVGLYAIYQAIRLLVSNGGNLTPYSSSLTNVMENGKSLTMIALGLASSRDVSWLWELTAKITDVGLLLPPGFLLLAQLVALPLALITMALPVKTARLSLRHMLIAAGTLLLGYGSAMLVFLPLGNGMQARYSYTGVIYLTILFGLILGWLLTNHRSALARIGLTCVAVLLSWLLYRGWSNTWENWYPARLVSEQLIDDARQTYIETGAQRIFLVNEPKAVGNAFALTRDWAYSSVAHLYISSQLDLSADTLVTQLSGTDLTIGNRFSEKPCVFLSWRNGARVIATQALSENGALLLNCASGQVEQAPPSYDLSRMLQYRYSSSQENLLDFLGRSRYQEVVYAN